jgi:plastocyanin
VTRPGRFLFAVAVILAAGCGGSGGASEPVATTEVAMAKSYRFDPGTIEIVAGQTVTWHNEDNFTHTVQVEGRRPRGRAGRERLDHLRGARHVRVPLPAP